MVSAVGYHCSVQRDWNIVKVFQTVERSFTIWMELVDTRVLERKREKAKKSRKIVMFDSQVSLESKGHKGLEKEKEKHSRI